MRVNKWELLYRNAEILWEYLGDSDSIQGRRQVFHNYLKVNCREYPKCKKRKEFNDIISLLVDNWCELFDQYNDKKEEFLFPNGYSVLFFLKIMWANETVLLRGQFDSRWMLPSRLFRSNSDREELINRGVEFLEGQPHQS